METIVFLTLFLGLTNGPQTVEVATSDQVRSVEIRLDGESRSVLRSPPWRTRIDLGDELAPRRLTAIAVGRAGEELGRAEQWINLPRLRAEAKLVLDLSGDVAIGRLIWETAEPSHPSRVTIRLDGEELAVDDPGRFPLPDLDPEILHVLSAEVSFPHGLTARTDLAFGGPYGEEVSAGLTVVPVRVERRRRVKDLNEVGRWLSLDGRELRIVALDRGPADLFAVKDRSAESHLRYLGAILGERLGARRVAVEEGSERYRLELPPSSSRRQSVGTSWHRLRGLGMEPGDRLFLQGSTVATTRENYEIFRSSDSIDNRLAGPAWYLTQLVMPRRAGARQRLSDATATAGLRVSASGRPRAVLLILGPEPEDRSQYRPSQVRRYLDRIRVPLVVVFVELLPVSRPEMPDATKEQREAAMRAAEETRARNLARTRRVWGEEVISIEGLESWLDLFRDLREDLHHQRLLWVDGIHPPAAIELSGAPEWVHPVGGESGAAAEE